MKGSVRNYQGESVHRGVAVLSYPRNLQDGRLKELDPILLDLAIICNGSLTKMERSVKIDSGETLLNQGRLKNLNMISTLKLSDSLSINQKAINPS